MPRYMLALGLLGCVALVQCTHAKLIMSKDCPGNLLVNGGFEQPNTVLIPSDFQSNTSNSKWGWYRRIPGWYTTRPGGAPCVRVDWQSPWMEIAQGAMASPVEGIQYAELLPNGTGNYCQDVNLQKGATYKLSYYYGRMMTFSVKTNNKFHAFDTAVDVAVRPAGPLPPPPASARTKAERIWPRDKQGFTVVSQADTAKQWAETQKQWVKHETTFVAPSNKIELAFINTIRPPACGSCGSLLDMVCLVKA